MIEEPIDPYYQKRANEFINVLIKKNYFSNDVTLYDLNQIKDILAYHFQMYSDNAAKLAGIITKLKEITNDGK